MANNFTQQRMRRVWLITLVCLVAVMTAHNASAQGLPGSNLGPDEIPGRAPIPDLIPGKSNQERWNLVTKSAPKLIGMSQVEIKRLFGKGVSRKKDELTYQITEAEQGGKLAGVQIQIKFVRDAVTEYSIIGIWRSSR